MSRKKEEPTSAEPAPVTEVGAVGTPTVTNIVQQVPVQQPTSGVVGPASGTLTVTAAEAVREGHRRIRAMDDATLEKETQRIAAEDAKRGIRWDVSPNLSEPPLSYPPSKTSLAKTPMAAVLRIWVADKRQLCNDERCYYPLNPVRDATTNYEVQTVETGKGKAIIAVCSWDPRHCDGKQLIYPPPKDDETEK